MQIISMVEVVCITALLIILTEQYFYQELNLSSKEWKWIGVSLVGLGLLDLVMPDSNNYEIVVALAVRLLVITIILLKSGRNRWKKIFYVIPAQWVLSIGITCIWLVVGMATPMSIKSISMSQLGTPEPIIFLGLFYVATVLCIGNYLRYKKQKNKEGVLGAHGIFVVWMMLEVSSIGVMLQDGLKSLETSGSVAGMLIMVTLVILVLQSFGVGYIIKSKYANYYKELTVVNKQYMELQLKYFDEYKKNQEETRRFRHDINNHLLCMKNLYAQDKKAEFLGYMDQVTDCVEELSMRFVTGNDVADAIINEKYHTINAKHIAFECEGNFPETYKVEPIDLCIILSNLLDNAIEGCLKVEDQDKRKIRVEIQHSKNFTMIRVTNSAKGKIRIRWNHIVSTKGDSENHGWGLKNIRRVASKYGGDVALKSDETEFVVEIIV